MENLFLKSHNIDEAFVTLNMYNTIFKCICLFSNGKTYQKSVCISMRSNVKVYRPTELTQCRFLNRFIYVKIKEMLKQKKYADPHVV